MAVQLATSTRNARLNAIETDAGVSAILKLRTGAQPADCGTADSGTVIATINLPSDYFNAASGGTMTKLGTWQDASADSSGTPAHFRLYKTDGTTCIAQGTVGQGSGDLSLDNTTVVAGQTVTVNTFTLTDGNA
jgi:hypothetical protein